MLPNDSTTLTATQAVYSAGVSPSVSTRRWGLLMTPSQVTWHDQTSSGRILHSIEYADSTDPTIPAAALIRIVCHILVDRLPEVALAELLESLRCIYEFHQEQSLPSLPPPSTRFAVRLREAHERPTFAITEE